MTWPWIGPMTRVKAQTTVFPFCSPSPPLSLLLFIHFLHLPIPIANKNITYIHTYKMNNNFRVTRTPEETPTTSSTFLNPIQVSSLFVNFPFYFLNFFFFWGTLAVFSRVTDGMKDANFFFFFLEKRKSVHALLAWSAMENILIFVITLFLFFLSFLRGGDFIIFFI